MSASQIVRQAGSIGELRGPAGATRSTAGEFDQSAKRDRRNADGGVLMYRVQFARKDPKLHKFNRINGEINDYKYSIERGVTHVMPWFVVDFWRCNSQVDYEQTTDAAGNKMVVMIEGFPEQIVLAEPINPPEGFKDGEHVEVSIARWRRQEANAAADRFEQIATAAKAAKGAEKAQLEDDARVALETANQLTDLALVAERAIDPNRAELPQ